MYITKYKEINPKRLHIALLFIWHSRDSTYISGFNGFSVGRSE